MITDSFMEPIWFTLKRRAKTMALCGVALIVVGIILIVKGTGGKGDS